MMLPRVGQRDFLPVAVIEIARLPRDVIAFLKTPLPGHGWKFRDWNFQRRQILDAPVMRHIQLAPGRIVEIKLLGAGRVGAEKAPVRIEGAVALICRACGNAG
jgi:hypothetical protein